MLFVQVVTGFQKYADTNGYSYRFRCAGAHRDQTLAETTPNKQKRTRMVAIDAKPFNRDKLEQYREFNICRELKKALVGVLNK